MKKTGWVKIPAGQPVKVEVLFSFPLPKSTRKAYRETWCHRVARPDADNLIKGTLDAMSAAGVWDDDQQVAVLHITKANAPRGLEGVNVIVEVIDDPTVRFYGPPHQGLSQADGRQGPD
jgi:Holliday junction resolvase RusA-like endonuclease